MAKKAAAKKEAAPKAEAKSWFRRGTDGLDEIKNNEELQKQRKERYATDFWLSPDESAKIIFVDDSEGAFWCYRHGLKHAGSFHKFTCTKDFDAKGCPICAKGKDYYPALVAHYTIIDLREYTVKKGPNAGNVVKASKKLYPVKGKTMQKRIADLSKKYGGLVGKVFEVKRYTDKDAACGSIIDLATDSKGKAFPKVDIATRFKDIEKAAEPFDYEKVLAFPTPAELAVVGIQVDGYSTPSTQQGAGTDASVADEEIDELFK